MCVNEKTIDFFEKLEKLNIDTAKEVSVQKVLFLIVGTIESAIRNRDIKLIDSILARFITGLQESLSKYPVHNYVIVLRTAYRASSGLTNFYPLMSLLKASYTRDTDLLRLKLIGLEKPYSI